MARRGGASLFFRVQVPLRETSKRNRTPERKFAIEETMDSGEIQSEDEEDLPNEEMMLIPEPVVEITEAHEDDEDAILNEMECLNMWRFLFCLCSWPTIRAKFLLTHIWSFLFCLGSRL